VMTVVVRIVWFIAVGWWLGLVWFAVSILACLTAIWYNVGLFMAVNTPSVMMRKKPIREIVDDVRRVR